LKYVLFRVDADKRLGMGHISRCLELAKQLHKLNVTPYFLIKNNESASKLIKESGFHHTIISKSANEKTELSVLMNLHHKIKFDCLFVDLKKTLSKEFFIKLNKICKTIVIDNTHRNSLNADLIIWPWVKEQYPTDTVLKYSNKILIGPNYMLLGTIKKNKKNKKRKESILISMGGSDKRGLTLKIIKSFKKTKQRFQIDIALGRFFSDSKKIVTTIKNDRRFTVIMNNDNLISLMPSYNVAILSFGITTFEAFFSGLPSLVISHSNENHNYAKKTAAYECMKYLGTYKMVNFGELPQATFSLMKDIDLCKKYSRNSRMLVDGKGSKRIAKRIVEIIN